MSDTSTHGCLEWHEACGAQRNVSCVLVVLVVLPIAILSAFSERHSDNQSINTPRKAAITPQNGSIRSKPSYLMGGSAIGHRKATRLLFVCSASQPASQPAWMLPWWVHAGARPKCINGPLHMPFQTIALQHPGDRGMIQLLHCFLHN